MRQIPDDNLAYPVSVMAGNSRGSGFFLTSDTQILFVTASHVLFDQNTHDLLSDQATLTSYPIDQTLNERNILHLDLLSLLRLGKIKVDYSLDITVIYIGNRDAATQRLNTYANIVNLVESSQTGIVGVKADFTKLYNEVMVANNVYVFGYPVSLGLPHIPQLDFSRPLLRSGIVAGKNAASGSIILDCAVYPGNSGGPVLEVEQVGSEYQYRVIGVVTQFIPVVTDIFGVPAAGALVNSGYSVVAAMDGVFALVKQFSA
jgi:Trypsin-like peptidase domain